MGQNESCRESQSGTFHQYRPELLAVNKQRFSDSYGDPPAFIAPELCYRACHQQSNDTQLAIGT